MGIKECNIDKNAILRFNFRQLFGENNYEVTEVKLL